jgi:hypothetical protein
MLTENESCHHFWNPPLFGAAALLNKKHPMAAPPFHRTFLAGPGDCGGLVVLKTCFMMMTVTCLTPTWCVHPTCLISSTSTTRVGHRHEIANCSEMRPHATALATTSHGSQQMSWIMDHGSWVMGHGSWVMGHGSWVMGHGSHTAQQLAHVLVFKMLTLGLLGLGGRLIEDDRSKCHQICVKPLFLGRGCF